MDVDLLIRGGRVVTADGEFDADVGIDGERIVALAAGGLRGRSEIDASGLLVLPGAVDGHVHFDDSDAPPDLLADTLGSASVIAHTFASGSRAAALGGVTTVVDFAMPPAGSALVEGFEGRLEDARPAIVDYGLHITVRDAAPERLAELAAVMERGSRTVKMYMAYEGYVLDDDAVRRTMREVARLGALAVLHAENHVVTTGLERELRAQGRTRGVDGLARPASVEGAAVQLGIALAELAGARLLVFHLSAEQAIAAVRAARRRGVAVSAEALVHHLAVTDDAYARGDYPLMTVPPLRAPHHRDALWAALADGDVDMVSSDHYPLPPGPDATSYGTAGLEPRLALVHTLGVGTGRISRRRWVDVCCTAPARILGLARKGRLAPGYDADIALFDPKRQVVLSSETLDVPHPTTLFDGITVTGWPVATISRGTIVASDGEVVADAGRGRFVPTGG